MVVQEKTGHIQVTVEIALLFNGYQGFSPGGKSSRGVRLNPYLSLVPMVKKNHKLSVVGYDKPQ
jgi:hypothetical protein